MVQVELADSVGCSCFVICLKLLCRGTDSTEASNKFPFWIETHDDRRDRQVENKKTESRFILWYECMETGRERERERRRKGVSSDMQVR